MSTSHNMVELLGNLGANAEPIKGGIAFNVATTERWTDKDQQPRERTDWHRCVYFGDVAARLAPRVRKGERVFITGKLRQESYTDKDNVKRWSTDVIVANVILLSPPPANARRAQHDDHDNPADARAPR